MSNKAFYFQNDTLLLPVGYEDLKIDEGVPVELSKDFDNFEVFEIPSLVSDQGVYVVSVLPGEVLPDNWRSIPVRQVLAMMSVSDAGLGNLLRACHIVQWKHTSRFCGSCGAKNNDGILAQDTSPHRCCPNCGRHEFPRICPAIIVLITDDKENKILLAHNKKFRTGIYSHISGFNEAGETLEETIVREIREEVNINVKDIVYVKSQPWPFPESLMIGFKARYLSGEVKPDGIEIEDAKWFSKDYLAGEGKKILPAEGSLSRYMINSWIAGKL